MADPITVEYFSSWDVTRPATVTIWTKAKWSDAWTEEPDLWLDECRWATSPTLPTASFTYRYGKKAQAGTEGNPATFVDVNRRDFMRKLVKVRVAMGEDNGARRWYGIVDSQQENMGGTIGGKVYGTARIVAYGLEKALDDQAIDSHWHRSPWLDAADLKGDDSPAFNAKSIPNRVKEKEGRPAYVFAVPWPKPFEAETEYWSTKDIAEYLLELLSPVDGAGVKSLPFAVASGAWFSDFDKQEIPAYGRTVKNVLDALASRQRGLTWWLEVNGEETAVELKTATLTPTNVTLDTGKILPEAARQIELQCHRDASAKLQIRAESADQFDQVVVRGAKRTTTLSLKNEPGGDIVEGWTSESKTEYDAGAGVGTGTEDKQRRDRAWRSQSRLRPVYAWFRLPDEWDQEGSPESDEAPAFVKDDNAASKASPLLVEIAPTLALEQEVDYSEEDAVGKGQTAVYRPIFVAVPIGQGAARKWHAADGFGANGTLGYERPTPNSQMQWSASAQVVNKPTGSVLVFRLANGLQHTIAKEDFTPAGAWDAKVHKHDWREFWWTVTLVEDRFCEAVEPATPSESTPLVRRLVIDAGDAYRCDRLLKRTIIGVNRDGSLQESPDESRYIRDDRKRLQIIARMAYAWYKRTRRAVTYQTNILDNRLLLGDFIRSIGPTGGAGDDGFLVVNSTITEITFTHGHSEGGRPQPQSLRYGTDFCQLDPLQR